MSVETDTLTSMSDLFVVFEIQSHSYGERKPQGLVSPPREIRNDFVSRDREPVDQDEVRDIESELARRHNVDTRFYAVVLIDWKVPNVPARWM